jgi:hypothetical protein
MFQDVIAPAGFLRLAKASVEELLADFPAEEMRPADLLGGEYGRFT